MKDMQQNTSSTSFEDGRREVKQPTWADIMSHHRQVAGRWAMGDLFDDKIKVDKPLKSAHETVKCLWEWSDDIFYKSGPKEDARCPPPRPSSVFAGPDIDGPAFLLPRAGSLSPHRKPPQAR